MTLYKAKCWPPYKSNNGRPKWNDTYIMLPQIGMNHPQILILLDMDLLKRENILSAINVENWDIMQIIVLILKKRKDILHIVVDVGDHAM
jgi:hypothetical protein